MEKTEKVRYNAEIELTERELIDFIYRSKLLSYARTDDKVSRSDGSSLYSNRELPWLYTDTYCGNTIEKGSEDVYYNMVLVWSMQYRGGYYVPYWSNAEILSVFLKEALLRAPKDFPARGPAEFSLDQISHEGKTIHGELLYRNQWTGNIGHFIGREFMYLDGDLFFYHDYIGGIVRNKYFPSKILTQQREHEAGSNDSEVSKAYPDLKLTNPPK